MEQVKQIAYTVIRVFIGTLLAAALAALANGLDVFTINWEIWQPFVAAAVIAAATVIVNALNPKDPRYGLGVSSE